MSKAAQLKKKASEFEQKKQYDRALATYVQAIEEAAGIPDEIDIPLYNRVGDLHLRLGDLGQAVTYYEMAVDLYAEGGFFNNAIALCNKVLRHSPSRSSIYYKLGKISAKKGFNSDAKQNFLEYASRMQQEGEINEAFRSLKEFADLCPGQDDVRLMLADQLAKADRTAEALEQLHIVYDTMVAEDRMTEAAATLERMRALDPSIEPRQGRTQPREKRDGLVFIDVSDEMPKVDASPTQDGSQVLDDGFVVDAHHAMDGLEPTSSAPESALVLESLLEDRPLTVAEFAEVDFPAVADVHVPGTLDDSALAGLESFADPIEELNSSRPVETVQPFDTELLAATDAIIDEPTMFPSHLAQDDTFGDEAGSGSGSLLFLGDAHEDEMPSNPSTQSASFQPPQDTPPVPPVAPNARADDEFVDLQAWLIETEPPKNPRMVTEGETQEEGTIQTDFTNLLEAFKRGIAENVDESDSESHYDLGVAYMEMGLLDDAIGQFQKVIRSGAAPERRVRAYESLGQCFIERQQYSVVISSLAKALREPGFSDDTLVGVLFLLGYASEAEHQWRDAYGYYQRVFIVDIHFRDVGDRLRRMDEQVRNIP